MLVLRISLTKEPFAYKSIFLKNYFTDHTSKFSPGTISQLEYRYHIQAQDYITLTLLLIFILISTLVYIYKRCSSKKNKNLTHENYNLFLTIHLFKYLLISSLFFIYFPNLISFLTIIKLVKSPFFGVFEYAQLLLRSFLLVLSLYFQLIIKQSDKLLKEYKNEKVKFDSKFMLEDKFEKTIGKKVTDKKGRTSNLVVTQKFVINYLLKEIYPLRPKIKIIPNKNKSNKEKRSSKIQASILESYY